MLLLLLCCGLLLFPGCIGGRTAEPGAGTLLPTAEPGAGTLPGLDEGAAPPVDALSSNSGLSGQVMRSSSGNPTGIRVRWASLIGDVIHYHLYKSADPIPDSARGNSSFWWDEPGVFVISQPGVPGSDIVIDDTFAIAIGEDWYYRVSAVDSDGDESHLSPELQVAVVAFDVTRLTTPLVRVGGTFVIEGSRFGMYDPTGDKVEVQGVEWQDGIGFVPLLIEAPVVSWEDERIEAQLPLGATSGPAVVTVAGASAPTPEDLTNADPYITSLAPLTASVILLVILQGNNFGDNFDAAHRVIFSGTEYLDATGYAQYDNTTIAFLPPNLRDYQQHPVQVRVDSVNSNTGFLNLTNADPNADLVANPPAGASPLLVNLDASGSSDPEGAGLRFRWDLDGDGQFELDTGEVSNVDAIFQPGGIYTPAVNVRDVDGGSATATVQVNVNDLPIADIQAFPQFGRVPLLVQFDAAGSSDPDGIIVKFEWDFEGDGTYDADTGDVPFIEHVYNNAGTYFATVRVTDDKGATATANVIIDVI
ncbi:PKD domain-containing protein [bacterium]|nr:PKD domain-containing protein [bacterium]